MRSGIGLSAPGRWASTPRTAGVSPCGQGCEDVGRCCALAVPYRALRQRVRCRCGVNGGTRSHGRPALRACCTLLMRPAAGIQAARLGWPPCRQGHAECVGRPSCRCWGAHRVEAPLCPQQIRRPLAPARSTAAAARSRCSVQVHAQRVGRAERHSHSVRYIHSSSCTEGRARRAVQPLHTAHPCTKSGVPAPNTAAAAATESASAAHAATPTARSSACAPRQRAAQGGHGAQLRAVSPAYLCVLGREEGGVAAWRASGSPGVRAPCSRTSTTDTSSTVVTAPPQHSSHFTSLSARAGHATAVWG